MKILHNLCLHFARQDGQDGKKRKENHTTKVTKNQKTKIWDERNTSCPNMYDYSLKSIDIGKLFSI